MQKNFDDHNHEMEISSVARIIGRDNIADILTRMSEREYSRVASIASNARGETLTKDQAKHYLSIFLDRVKRIAVLSELDSEEIHSQISKRLRFSGERYSDTGMEGFMMLSEKDPDQIKDIIDRESSTYVKAVILAHLDYSASEKVLSLYPLDEKISLIKEIDAGSTPKPDFIEKLSNSLVTILKETGSNVHSHGIKSIVQMVERMPEPKVIELLERMDEEDPDLAERIRDNIMTFEDIMKLDGDVLQVIFDAVEPRSIALATRDYGSEQVFKVTESLTKKKQEGVQNELEIVQNSPEAAINDAKKDIVRIAKDLESKNKISLQKKP